MSRVLLQVIHTGQRGLDGVPGAWPRWRSAAGPAGPASVSGMMGGNHSLAGAGGAAVTVRLSVTVRQVLEDGSEVPVEGELAAALAGPAEQFAGLVSWTAEEARYLDHGEREEVIGQEGRELQRRLLEATFALDIAREERVPQVTSVAGIRHGTAEDRKSTRLNSSH